MSSIRVDGDDNTYEGEGKNFTMIIRSEHRIKLSHRTSINGGRSEVEVLRGRGR